MIKKIFYRIGRKLELSVLKYRLGKSRFSSKALVFLMSRFERFEEYSNKENVGNFDHYVPQFLLRFFGKDNNGNKKGIIYAYSFESKRVQEKPIKDVAGLIDHDTFREKTGKLSDYVSKRLYAEKVERFGSVVISQINSLDKEPSLTFFEESILATFMACQLTRVPKFHSNIKLFIEYLYEKRFLAIDNLQSLEYMKSQIVENGRAIDIDSLLSYKPNFSLEGMKNHIGLLSRLIANEIAEKIYRGNLHILDIPKGSSERFVISDNPVVLLDFERSEVLRYPAWWDINKKELWIFMPISPTRCIFYAKSRRKDGMVERDYLPLIQVVNFGQYLNAQEFVFADNKKVIEKQLKDYATELDCLRL